MWLVALFLSLSPLSCSLFSLLFSLSSSSIYLVIYLSSLDLSAISLLPKPLELSFAYATVTHCSLFLIFIRFYISFYL
jgi:hypothetical protein